MKMTMMEGWPTEIVFFSSVFLSFFTWSSLCALLVCIVLIHFPSFFTGSFYGSAKDISEEKQLLLLTVAAAQVIEIHVATTKKRGLLLKMKGFVGVVDDVAVNLERNQRWGWSSLLEETLLMADDGVLLLST
ncbi:hypothetical protein Peur_064633 [Populus x canadensis]